MRMAKLRREYCAVTLEEKVNKWSLRLFESLWAMQVDFLAADINDLGLA